MRKYGFVSFWNNRMEERDMNVDLQSTDSNEWQERYQNLQNSLNIGLLLVDPEFIYLDVNKTYLKMVGLSREELVGRHTSEFYSEEEFKRLKEILLSLRKQDNFQYEFVLPTSSGERIPVIQNTHIQRDSNGRHKYAYVTITDIRKQKKVQEELRLANQALTTSFDTLEKEKKKLEAILFGIGDCVTIFDTNGTVLLSNPQGMEIRDNRRSPFLPLKSGSEKQITLQVGEETRQFLGQIQEIRDQQGTLYAYVETLKDITPQIKLVQREHELSRIKREMRRNKLETEMIGVSRAMQKIMELVLRCAEVDSTILILGETGVGKEVAARAIHSHSSRRDKPFVAVNCGALPESLLESELFGHVKGAFTGAISERPGLFREAEGGTLFLDEIGDINTDLQVKLLRALQEKEIRPVGGNQMYPVDVRVIAATNRDLEKLVGQGHFRNDLYYRIAVIPLLIPPLTERREDILLLAEHFIKKYRKKTTTSPRVLDHATQQVLLDYTWPGNIRELENAIEHCVAMTIGSTITLDSLPVQILNNSKTKRRPVGPLEISPDMNRHPRDGDISQKDKTLKLSDAEKDVISDALRRHNGNRTITAKDLGISRSTILRKIKKYQLDQIAR
jgi:PAS domain S-box-containing protein